MIMSHSHCETTVLKIFSFKNSVTHLLQQSNNTCIRLHWHFFLQVSANLDLLESIYVFPHEDDWNLEKGEIALAKLTLHSIDEKINQSI